MKRVLVLLMVPSWGLLSYDESHPAWSQTYGGSNYDVGKGIAVDPDGYYVVVGGTRSFGAGNYDYWILKLDPTTGDTLWSRTYGGSLYDYAYSVAVDSDGYYVVNGITGSFGSGYHDFWILKIDPMTGDTVWSRVYGGTSYDQGSGIMVDADGYYVAIGHTRSFGTDGSYDAWILKLEPTTGDTLWSVVYGGSDYDRVFGITGDDSTYTVVGYEESPEINGDSARQGWVFRIRADDGTLLWMKSYGGDDYDVFSSVKMDGNGNLVVAGRTASFSAGSRDGWLLLLDPETGDTIRTSILGGADDDRFYGVAVGPDGNYYAAGYTYSFGEGSMDLWVVKFDSATGDTLWTATFGADSADRGESITIDGEGYIAITGYTKSYGNGRKDVWILRLNGVDLVPPSIDSLTVLDRDTTGDARDVSAIVMDDRSGVESAYLFYRAGTGAWNSVPLSDAGGGWFSGQIPPMPLPDDSIQVFYFVQATDSAGNTSTSDTLDYYLVNPAVSSREAKVPPFWIGNGSIVFTISERPINVKIFDAGGRLILSRTFNRNAKVRLKSGIYILIIDGKRFKVPVR